MKDQTMGSSITLQQANLALRKLVEEGVTTFSFLSKANDVQAVTADRTVISTIGCSLDDMLFHFLRYIDPKAPKRKSRLCRKPVWQRRWYWPFKAFKTDFLLEIILVTQERCDCRLWFDKPGADFPPSSPHE